MELEQQDCKTAILAVCSSVTSNKHSLQLYFLQHSRKLFMTSVCMVVYPCSNLSKCLEMPCTFIYVIAVYHGIFRTEN